MTRHDAERPTPPRSAIWLLSMVTDARSDPLIGDLLEEYALRSSSARGRSASRWCWSQVWLSMPPLLWDGIRRGGWMTAIAVALLPGACVMSLALASDLLLARWLAGSPRAFELISLTSFLLVTALGGYVTARLRRGAVIALAAFIAAVGLVTLATVAQTMPLWQQVVFVAAGPSASLAGARVRG